MSSLSSSRVIQQTPLYESRVSKTFSRLRQLINLLINSDKDDCDISVTYKEKYMQKTNSKIENKYGFINYQYIESCEKYPDGLLLFMGSFINKEFRGNGIFKKLIKELFEKFPENSLVQVPLSEKRLVSLFKRLDFHEVLNIEFWGVLSNTINMEGRINRKMLELL